jgi:hypothetical protein
MPRKGQLDLRQKSLCEMKDIVIGFCTNQNEHNVKVFCLSLRRVYSPDQCDLVLVTDRYEEYFTELARYGVHFMSTVSTWTPTTTKISKLINRIVLKSLRTVTRLRSFNQVLPEIAASYPVLIETWHHPFFVRWFAYQRFLTLNRMYRNVFLSDVKDVLFQAPLFDSATDCVSLFEEEEVFGTAYWNTKWYREAFGAAELAKVIGKKPICMGTILGPHSEVLSLVQELGLFFARHLFFGQVDQAILNYMVLNDLIRTPYKIVANVSGPVATLSDEIARKATITRDGYICRAADNSIIPAVHMYNPGAEATLFKEYLQQGQGLKG